MPIKQDEVNGVDYEFNGAWYRVVAQEVDGIILYTACDLHRQTQIQIKTNHHDHFEYLIGVDGEWPWMFAANERSMIHDLIKYAGLRDSEEDYQQRYYNCAYALMRYVGIL